MKPFTLDEHKVIGESLLAIRNYLKDLADDATARYGRKISRRRLGYLTARLDHVRSAMLEQLLEDQGVKGSDPRLVAIYFPPVRQAAGQAEGVQA